MRPLTENNSLGEAVSGYLSLVPSPENPSLPGNTAVHESFDQSGISLQPNFSSLSLENQVDSAAKSEDYYPYQLLVNFCLNSPLLISYLYRISRVLA